MRLPVEADPRGNLLARIAGRSDRTVLLCAHLDTVEVTARSSRSSSTAAGRTRTTRSSAPTTRRPSPFPRGRAPRERRGCAGGVELLLTVEEEDGLAGAKAFDASVLRADFGYVFDHATPIGGCRRLADVLPDRAPSSTAAPRTPGIRPEAGRSAIVAAAQAIAAMPHGRIDEQTTANVGSVSGGSGTTNVVAERCALLAEARSLDPDRVEEVVARMIDAVHDGAAAAECDVDVVCEKLFDGYRTKATAPAIVAAEAALAACGYEPRRIVTGGGSDANALALKGIECVNLANGTERNHEPTERVSVAALEGMFDVCLALLDEAAAAMSSRFERLEARTVFEGTSSTSARAASATRTAGRSRASGSCTPARSASSPTTASTSGWCASRARRPASRTCSSSPRGSSTRRGRARWSAASASSPRRSASRPPPGST